jgi:hypothetical protein
VFNNFAHSQKSLQDLTKLSFKVYENLDKLPLRKKVILPKVSGDYKFIVTLNSSFAGPLGQKSEGEYDSQDIVLISNEKPRHKEILR